MSSPGILIFDLDGTLVDTAPDLAGTMNALLSRHGRRELPLGDVRHMVGEGARALMARAWERTGQAASAAELDDLFDAFIAHYLDNLAVLSRPFPGVVDTLEILTADGWAMAVCTNKAEAAAVRLLEALSLTGHFRTIIGGDTLPAAKPDPAPLEAAASGSGGTLANAIMIGDSRTDIAAARAAGVPVIALTHGYSREPVATFKPDQLIDSLPELPAALKRIVNAPS